MKKNQQQLFSPATTLLSQAWWLVMRQPVPVLVLGVGGVAPFAALFLFFLLEADESYLIAGTVKDVMWPLALGLAAVYLVRFPFRLALAKWQAGFMDNRAPSLPSALRWGVFHSPAALFYGGVSTLGWMLGTVLFVPFFLTFQSSLAFHRFAATDLSAMEAWKESGKIPAGARGLTMLSALSVVYLLLFLIFWTTPSYAMSLVEWLLKANMAGLRKFFPLRSIPWISVCLVFAGIVVEALWFCAYGLLSAEWQRLSNGSDLLRTLEKFEQLQEEESELVQV